ncbi:MAG: COG1470 family protein, partial [Armatimonadota bacterium]
AIEVSTGPQIALDIPQLTHPGKSADTTVSVNQSKPEAGTITLILPAGWNPVKPISVPAQKNFKSVVMVKVPDGVFGRNYPIKAVFQSKSLKRTVATHLKVMEPLTTIYSFDLPHAQFTNCVDPGKPARLTIKCINNTPDPAKIGISVVGEAISANETYSVNGIKSADLGNASSKLNQWIELGTSAPDNVIIKTIDYICPGIPSVPVQIYVTMNGKELFKTDAYPRTRIMDLNGEWKLNVTPPGRTNAGGYEGGDTLDMQSLTPDVWDGKWKSITTPFDLKNPATNTSPWATYRRLVYIPSEWQGTDVWIRLNVVGTGWGKGTMSLVYVNGWPAGRVGQSGDKQLSELLNYGGWNLIAVASFMPDAFRDPYLFVRNAPIPSRIKPHEALLRPIGAFLLMNRRPSGQGLTRPFLQGTPDGDHIRTDRALGSEWQFIHFAISDEFMKEPAAPVEVEVEYLDEGTDMVSLDYDSTDPTAPINGAFKSAPGIQKTNTGKWKTAVFKLDDARFANREHQGSDFRIYGSKEDLHLRRVEVRLASK